MSYQAVRWAMYEAPHLHTATGLIDTTARTVLIVLAEHADEHGANAHPSPLRIRYATGLDLRTIDRAVKRLENGKLISRQGVVRSGTVRWRLNLDLVRSETEWEDLQSEMDHVREIESAKRKARRERLPSMPGDLVRDSASRTPGFKMPDAGILRPGVRDAAPPEPPRNHQGTTRRTTPGGAPPPDPRRLEDPSDLRNGHDNSVNEPVAQVQDQQSYPLPRENAEPPPTDPGAPSQFAKPEQTDIVDEQKPEQEETP